MKYCRHCGKEMPDEAAICVNCGVPVNENVYKKTTTHDSGSFGWSVLGFFFPLIGLILFLVWKEEKPATSKAAGKGALIGVIVEVVVSVITVIIYAVALSNFPAYFGAIL